MRVPIIYTSSKRVSLVIVVLVLVMQLFAPLFISQSVSAAAPRPSDDRSELYDEVLKMQHAVSLIACMNRKDQDPGDNRITYNQAIAGPWFKEDLQVYAGYIAGEVYCNDMVARVAEYLDKSPIQLLCMFVDYTQKFNGGAARCQDIADGVPGAEQYNFNPLDFGVKDANDVDTGEGTYSVRYYNNVILSTEGGFGLNRDRSPSFAARYFMYYAQFMGDCQATPRATSLSGYKSTDIKILTTESATSGGSFGGLFGGTGSTGSTDNSVEVTTKVLEPTTYFYRPESSSSMLFYFPMTDSDYGAKFNVPAYPTTLMIAAGSTIRGNITVADTYEVQSMNSSVSLDKQNYVFGGPSGTGTGDRTGSFYVDFSPIWGFDSYYDGEENAESRILQVEFMDCAAIAQAINNYALDYQNWGARKTVDDSTDEQAFDNDVETESSSCVIEGIGWIVCPVLSFMGNITGGTYQLISNFLEVDSSLMSRDSGTYKGWVAMRDIANVGLVIIFLIIIFSQVTNLGVSNYGIKKTLPKLVLMAILVNISFFIMQVAVDLSNILGKSLYDFFTTIEIYDKAATGFAAGEGNIFNDVIQVFLTGGAVVGAVGLGALAAGSVAYFGGIGLLVMIILSGLLAVMVTFAILAARVALIVLLSVVAPLAFLAMVLPNTKSLFDKWRKMFTSLLLVYPMIAILFSVSQLAAGIIMQNAGEGAVVEGVIAYTLALGVATVPLFAVIPMLKGSLNAVPALGNLAKRLGGAKPFAGKTKAGLAGMRKDIGNNTRRWAMESGVKPLRNFASGRARRGQRSGDWEHALKTSEAEKVADSILEDGGASLRSQSSAVMAKKKLTDEEISNIETLLDSVPPEQAISHAATKLDEFIKSGNVAGARAAFKVLNRSAPGRDAMTAKLLENKGLISDGDSYESAVSQALRADMLASGMKSKNVGLNNWAHGNGPTGQDLQAALTDPQNIAGLDDGEVASQDASVLKNLSSGITPGQARLIVENGNLNLTVEKREILSKVAGVTASPNGGEQTLVIPRGTENFK